MAIDFDRCARDRLGEQLAAALIELDLIRPNAAGRRITSAASAAAVFRELAAMIGQKDHFRVKVQTLAGRVGRTRSATSRALTALRAAGVVIHSRTGRSSLYSIDWPVVLRIVEGAARRREARRLEAATNDSGATAGGGERADPAASGANFDVPAAAEQSPSSPPAHRAPSVAADDHIGTRTVRHQMAHRAPSTLPNPCTKPLHPPPPPGDGSREGGAAGWPAGWPAGWLDAERELERAGVAAVGAAIQLARERGYSADQVIEIARRVAITECDGVRAYGAGAVFSRLKNGTPRQPIGAAFPAAAAEYGRAVGRQRDRERRERQAAEQRDAEAVDRRQAEQRERRFGAILDGLSTFEREHLVRAVGGYVARRFRADPRDPLVRDRLLAELERREGS